MLYRSELRVSERSCCCLPSSRRLYETGRPALWSRHSLFSPEREMRTTLSDVRRPLLLLFFVLLFGNVAQLVRGWEAGNEYVYDIKSHVLTTTTSAAVAAAAVEITGKLSVQSTDSTSLRLKLSEVKIYRHGNYTVSGFSNHINGFPAGASVDEEAVDDLLPLLSPFALVHNKGSMANLIVDVAEPHWSINLKKAIASQLQLDITGWRSEVNAGSGVFGERHSAAVDTFEDGVTGDCRTVLQITRLPLYQIMRQDQEVVVDECRYSNVYEILKIKDFTRCRTDGDLMARVSLTDQTRHLHKSAVYKYLACGESVERATLIRVEGFGELSFRRSASSFDIKVDQVVSLLMQSRSQIHHLLPFPAASQVFDSFIYTFDDAATPPSSGETMMMESVLELLEHVEDDESNSPDVDLTEKMNTASRLLARFDGVQLRHLWQENITRDLLLECTAASGSTAATAFIIDLIEQKEITGLQAAWALMSLGHSIRSPSLPILQRFVNLIRSEPVQMSKSLKRISFSVAAELLHSSCVSLQTVCHPDDHIVTENFLPLLVQHLQSARSTVDRLTAISALGALATDDVLLLLVPFIRGDESALRAAAIMALDRLVDTSPEKVLALLFSLADNVAERADVRIAALSVLLQHDNTPMSLWKRVAYRTWFDSSSQVQSFTCTTINSAAKSKNDLIRSNARSVFDLMRPCSGATDGIFDRLMTWRIGDNSLPVYLSLQLAKQWTESFNLDPIEVAVWNYNTDRYFPATDDDRPSNDSRLNDIWDHLSLGQERLPEDPVRLLHWKWMSSSLQGFLSMEEAGSSLADLFLSAVTKGRSIDIETVKFVKLMDTSVSLPTELGFPVVFTQSVPLMASLRGNLTVDAASSTLRMDMSSILSFKWQAEVRIQLPSSSGNYTAVGLEVRAELRGPKHLSLNVSNGSLSWLPDNPKIESDFAYFHARPYSYTQRTGAAVTLDPRQNSTSSVVVLLGPNVSLEMINGSDEASSLSIWLQRFMAGSFGSLSPTSFRLRYVPSSETSSLSAVTASLRRWPPADMQKQQAKTVDFISGTNDTLPLDDVVVNFTSPRAGHLFKAISIEGHHKNGSALEWASFPLQDIPCASRIVDWLEMVSVHNVSTNDDDDDDGNNSRLDWLYGTIQSILYHEGSLTEEKTATRECLVQSDRVKTFDRVEYSYYTLNNSCHHVLTTDCGAEKSNAFAVTLWTSNGSYSEKFVRVTLDKDVIDIGHSGGVSVNGDDSQKLAVRMRIRDSHQKVIASIVRLTSDVIRLELPNSDVLDVMVNESSVKIVVPAGRLQGRTCGLCGDNNGEKLGEFKNSAGCALSTGALMAASFQISIGLDDCPSLPENVLQNLHHETVPCSLSDEQIMSTLPLPPES